jgi:hypothetical protein
MKTLTVILVAAAIFVISAQGQGFGNLNFESARNLPGDPGYYGTPVAVTNALPDWIAYNGNSVLSDIYYVSNSFPGDSTSVELEAGSLALNGNSLTVGLYLGALISQTGLVPTDAGSLEFEAEGPGPGGSLAGSGFYITLGGQGLSYSALSEGSGYTVYAANIPADLDGQTEPLSFGIQGLGGEALIDNVAFSTSSVPEPGPYGLISVGVVLYGFWRFCLTTKNAKPA